MARRRRRSKAKSSSKRRSKRRRSGGGGFSGGGSRRGFAFLPPGGIQVIGATAAGFIGSDWVLTKLNLKQTASGWGRVFGKVAVGAAVLMLGRKFMPQGIAAGVAVGAMTSAGVDAYTIFRGGVAGLGDIGNPDAINYTALMEADDDDGVGALEEEIEYEYV